MIEEKVRRMNRIAMIWFIAAVIVFVVFHFLPWTSIGSDPRGWEIWPATIHPRNFTGRNLLPCSGFIATALLTLSSPFLMGIFRASCLTRRFCQVVSLMAFVSLSGYLLWSLMRDRGWNIPGPGMICLMVSQLLHLTGSLCLRGMPAPEDPFRCET